MNRCLWALLTFVVAAVLPGSLRAQAPLVVCTNTILLDVTRQLGGPDIRVESLVPAGVSPRDYDPTPDDTRLVAQAALLVVHGVDLDPWVDAVVREAGFNGEVIPATDRLPLLDITGRLFDPEDEIEFDFTQFDPYTWHDPRNVIHAARIIAVAIADLLPAQVAEINERLRLYVDELEALHTYATEQFALLPPSHRRVATSHDTLRYLGHTYDLLIGLIPGFEPGRTPQPAQLARMIDLVRSLDVPAVFFAPGTSALGLRAIEAETGVKTVTTLFTDTLGPPDSPEGSYVVRFRRNVDEIVKALR